MICRTSSPGSVRSVSAVSCAHVGCHRQSFLTRGQGRVGEGQIFFKDFPGGGFVNGRTPPRARRGRRRARGRRRLHGPCVGWRTERESHARYWLARVKPACIMNSPRPNVAAKMRFVDAWTSRSRTSASGMP